MAAIGHRGPFALAVYVIACAGQPRCLPTSISFRLFGLTLAILSLMEGIHWGVSREASVRSVPGSQYEGHITSRFERRTFDFALWRR
jgi:hypothetical protein